MSMSILIRILTSKESTGEIKMENITTIVNEVIDALTIGATNVDITKWVCRLPKDENIRVAIHSILRMLDCRYGHSCVYSPCFPGEKAKVCRHNECSYVIGHSMYIVASEVFGSICRGESGGCGCNFRHEKANVTTIREAVRYAVSQHQGGLGNRFLQAMMRMKTYYDALDEVSTKEIPVYNVSSCKAERVEIILSNDSIFESVSLPSKANDETERAEHTDATQGFSMLSLQANIVQENVVKESIAHQVITSSSTTLLDESKFPKLGSVSKAMKKRTNDDD